MIAIILIIVVVSSILLKKIFLKKNLQYEYYRDIPTKDSPAYVGKVIKGYANGNDIIATIIDAPATMLNVVGDTASSMMISKIVDGKNWLKK